MNKKPSKYKKELESEINKKLEEFVNNTGLSINYVDFNKEEQTGFIKDDGKYKTKIILKND